MSTDNTFDARVFASALQLVARAWRAKNDAALAELRMSTALAYPIMAIHRLGGGVRQSAVASALGIEGPSLVRSLDALSSAGLLERHDDPSDRRAKTLHLTPEGERLARRIEILVAQTRKELLDAIPQADLAAATRALQSIAKAAGISLMAPIALADADQDAAE
ncbi:MAG: MarR family winged helix-turn-helix transcriptional regulator [Methylovirgula sp.]